jgi:hypothetical protein
VFSPHRGKVLALLYEVQHMYKIRTKSMFSKNLVLGHGSFDRFRLDFSEMCRVLRMLRRSLDHCAYIFADLKKWETARTLIL